MKAITPEEHKRLCLLVGHAMGWITYPTDSVEQGDTFHLDADKAPFGRRLSVREFDPIGDVNDMWRVICHFEIQIDWRNRCIGVINKQGVSVRTFDSEHDIGYAVCKLIEQMQEERK